MSKITQYDGNVKSLEEYGGVLMYGVLGLKSMMRVHEIAEEEGLLNEDQQENASLILLNIKYIMALYDKQLQSAAEVAPFDINDMFNKIKKEIGLTDDIIKK